MPTLFVVEVLGAMLAEATGMNRSGIRSHGMDPTGSGRIGRRTNGVTIGGMVIMHLMDQDHHDIIHTVIKDMVTTPVSIVVVCLACASETHHLPDLYSELQRG